MWTLPSEVPFTQVGGVVWIDESAPPGSYRANVVALTIDWEQRKVEQRTGFVDFTIGGEPEPGPDPSPADAPFPAPGFTVMVLKEAKETGLLPESQKAIFTSPEVMQYLRIKCFEVDGIPAMRFWDDDYGEAELAQTPPFLKDAYRILLDDADGNLPWIGISDGETGTSQPLPRGVDEMMELLKQYGGE